MGGAARLSTTVAHFALINLALKSGLGRRLFHPFRAAGRRAFSQYFVESILGLWVLFSADGLQSWGPVRLGRLDVDFGRSRGLVIDYCQFVDACLCDGAS
jgi:hypothetical protein